MSAVTQPKGRKKSAIHAFGVQGQDGLQSTKVESQCGGAEVIHSTVEISPSDIVTRYCQGHKPKRGSKWTNSWPHVS